MSIRRTNVALAGNGIGLGAVERQPVCGKNCAKPVLAAGGIIQHKSLIGTLKKVF